MYKMVIMSTGDEEIFNSYNELVFNVLECYSEVDDYLLSYILRKLADIKINDTPFFTESEDGLYIEKMAD